MYPLALTVGVTYKKVLTNSTFLEFTGKEQRILKPRFMLMLPTTHQNIFSLTTLSQENNLENFAGEVVSHQALSHDRSFSSYISPSKPNQGFYCTNSRSQKATYHDHSIIYAPILSLIPISRYPIFFSTFLSNRLIPFSALSALASHFPGCCPGPDFPSFAGFPLPASSSVGR